MKGVSVVICCYNSEDRIFSTLKYLSAQKVDHGNWEVIIVDNNCYDKTSIVVRDYFDKCPVLHFRSKLVYEPKPGLNYARMTGVTVSNYDIVLFCDDDNWLNDKYISNAELFLRENLSYGIIGGNGIPKCEVEPPKWFSKLQSVYATGCRGHNDTTSVYGAGMALRKELILDMDFSLSDRKGNSLSSGGDSEICFGVLRKGYKIKQLCNNTFYHFIPKERLTYSYILKMGKAYGETNAQLFLLESPKMKGVLYRLRIDLLVLFKRLFSLDLVFFSFELNRRYYYWKTRFK